jgi:predicted RNase H-like nuclease (RuvC/YqgF family)
MGFIGVYRAVYDYEAQAEDELAITEGDLLFVLEKGDDGWWRAKKKAQSEDEAEPEGNVPNNYVEEVSPSSVPAGFASASVLTSHQSIC